MGLWQPVVALLEFTLQRADVGPRFIRTLKRELQL
jgi:hypothetical protein